MKRSDKRRYDQLRPIKIIRNFTNYAEGSVLIQMGNTKVICNASISDKVPKFAEENGQGWVTAEYSMLPRATQTRNQRERDKKLSGRSQEIQRLIGRSLRAAVDLRKLSGFSIILDNDVIQADGGTRVASINGSFIALYDAINYLIKNKYLKDNPIINFIGAISMGVVNNSLLLDLNYQEDSQAEIDMNLVLTDKMQIVEIQASAEGYPLDFGNFNKLIELGKMGIKKIIDLEKQILQQR